MALTTHRSRGRATAALLAALAALYPLARRPILTWGATTEEAGSRLLMERRMLRGIKERAERLSRGAAGVQSRH
jgi:hypothetical protein